MDAERAREFLLALPYVVESMQWGANLVYFIGDKARGGKMFALVDLEGELSHGVACWSAGPERFAELVEQESLFPARYLARAKWVAAENWRALRHEEWQQEFRRAHAIVFAKLPKRLQAELLAGEEKQTRKRTSKRSG